MRRTLHAATILLATSVFGPACLLDAGPYETGGSAGSTTTATTTTTGGTGGTTTTGGGGSTGATGGGGSMDPVCGNGKMETGESCDDGMDNSDTGDCTTMCKVATCGDGLIHTAGTGTEQCDNGANNSDTGDCTTMCKSAACGDGFVWAGHEDCDDGNKVDGDGCSAACKTICGDGKVVGAEQCEDGNIVSGDGCSATCTIESTCGNGRVDGDEVCDGGAACMDMCKSIDPASACGKAVPFTPAPPDANGVRTTHIEGDTNDMQTPNGEVLDPACADPHKVRLFTYKTGDVGSIVFAETKPGMVGGEPTFTDTTLWAYRDCVNKRAEEACSDDIASPPSAYSKIQTGYLPPHTTLFIVVGGHGDANVGKFILDIVEQPVTLLFGTTFDTDLSGMQVYDSMGDGSWAWCDGLGNCGGNSTKSWSGRGFATINDSTDKDHTAETLTSLEYDTSKLSSVYFQCAFDFSQKGGGGTESYIFLHSTDGSTYTQLVSDTSSTGGGIRKLFDVSGAAKSTSTYSTQVRYDDGGGQGNFIRVDDFYIYGY